MIDLTQYNPKNSIHEIFNFVEKISKQYKQFDPDFRNIKYLNERDIIVINGKHGYLTYSLQDLDNLERFLNRLLTDKEFIERYFYFSKTSQLHQLWNLLNVILNNESYLDISLSATTKIKDSKKISTETLIKEIENSNEYNELIEKNKITLIESEKDINEILCNFQRNRSIIKTLFTNIISRRETHHYTIMKILKEAKERSGLPFDIEEICSVEQKVKRDHSWETDIIAIRNCIGHTNPIIDDNLNIHFSNNKNGYNFFKSFKFEEFLYFYQDFYRLLLIQKISLTMVNLIQTLRKLLSYKKDMNNL